MKLKKITPELIVDDVNKSVEFYRELLGFEVAASVPDSGQLNWALLRSGAEGSGLEIMLESRTAVAKELPGEHNHSSAVVYLDVESIDRWHDQVKSKTDIKVPLHKTFYGSQEFAFQDPDGYWIMLAER